MMDSCSPRKLEPGFEEMYSSPTDFRTSTMKSDPVRSVVSTSTCEGSSSFGSIAAEAERAASTCAARTGVAPATSEATPPAAAPFRNLRRSTDSFLAMAKVLCGVVFGIRSESCSSHVYHNSAVSVSEDCRGSAAREYRIHQPSRSLTSHKRKAYLLQRIYRSPNCWQL